jgi:hypothetical protein
MTPSLRVIHFRLSGLRAGDPDVIGCSFPETLSANWQRGGAD